MNAIASRLSCYPHACRLHECIPIKHMADENKQIGSFGDIRVTKEGDEYVVTKVTESPGWELAAMIVTGGAYAPAMGSMAYKEELARLDDVTSAIDYAKSKSKS